MPDEQAATREPPDGEERVSHTLMILQTLGDVREGIGEIKAGLNRVEDRVARLEYRVEHLDTKIDDVRKELDRKIDGMNNRIDKVNDRLLGGIKWAAGTFIAVLGSTGAIIVAVLLHR